MFMKPNFQASESESEFRSENLRPESEFYEINPSSVAAIAFVVERSIYGPKTRQPLEGDCAPI